METLLAIVLMAVTTVGLVLSDVKIARSTTTEEVEPVNNDNA
ncbi:hypothetical protein [Furfurilactobacillus entadae]